MAGTSSSRSSAKGRNERAALAFLRSAGLKVEDDPRAAALLSAGIALDGRWDAATSREARQLRRELSEYIQAARPAAPDPGSPPPVDIVERLKRRSPGA